MARNEAEGDHKGSQPLIVIPKGTYIHIGTVVEKLEFKLVNCAGSTFHLEDLSRTPGFICPALDEMIHRPERYMPRAICLRDGRVYVKAQFLQESTYMDEYVPALVHMAKVLFWYKRPITLDDFTVIDCLT